MRHPVRLDTDLADHLDRLIGIEVPGVDDSDGPAAHGVVRGWSRPRLIEIAEVLNRRAWAQVRTAVYVACTVNRIVHYVGSVRRRDGALAPRLRQHLAEDAKRRRTWTHLALVPLPDGLDASAVLRCEGRVGRALDPLDNIRLPAVPGREPWVPRVR